MHTCFSGLSGTTGALAIMICCGCGFFEMMSLIPVLLVLLVELGVGVGSCDVDWIVLG